MLQNRNARIYISGHTGMVGSAFLRYFRENNYSNIILRNSKELDLRNSESVRVFFETERPEIVFLIAARVGGIAANMAAPADFLYDNLMIEANVIRNAAEFKAKKLIFFGSSCIYPRESSQPMKEEYLMTGPLEPTNEGYAIAKIAGLKLAQYSTKQYGLPTLSVMPSNLYGPNDSFDPLHSHVLSALVKKFCDAVKASSDSVTLWGTGAAMREFLHVHDLIDAVLFLDQVWQSDEIINVGPGEDISIHDLARTIAELTEYHGRINWDESKPDGMPRKCMDVSKLRNLGFQTKISLIAGIRQMIKEYRTRT